MRNRILALREHVMFSAGYGVSYKSSEYTFARGMTNGL